MGFARDLNNEIGYIDGANSFIMNDGLFVTIDPNGNVPGAYEFSGLLEESGGSFNVGPSYVRENLFEGFIAESNLPLPVVGTQIPITLKRPYEGNVIEEFSDPESADFFRILNEKKTANFEAIKSLLGRRAGDYTRRRYANSSDQRRLFDYTDGQPTLDFFQPDKRIPKDPNRAVLRLDLLFQNYDNRLIPGEVKGKSTTAPSEINDTLHQILSYHEVLSPKDKKTQIIFGLPTVPSLAETEMIKSVQEVTGREIVPVTVTTEDFVIGDITKRQMSSRSVVRSWKNVEWMTEEMAEYHGREIEHLGSIVSQIL